MGGHSCTKCGDAEAEKWFKRFKQVHAVLVRACQGQLQYTRKGDRMVCTVRLDENSVSGLEPAWLRDALADKSIRDSCQEIRLS